MLGKVRDNKKIVSKLNVNKMIIWGFDSIKRFYNMQKHQNANKHTQRVQRTFLTFVINVKTIYFDFLSTHYLYIDGIILIYVRIIIVIVIIMLYTKLSWRTYKYNIYLTCKFYFRTKFNTNKKKLTNNLKPLLKSVQ